MYQHYEFKDTNVMSFSEGKQLFISTLSPHLKQYEDRLKKPWFERSLEYYYTGFGEEGYKKIKSFINDLEQLNPEQSTARDLIALTAQEKYRKGNNFPKICRRIVLKICHFSTEHINVVEGELITLILTKDIRHRTSQLTAVPENAIIQIYERIVSSDDCGHKYLCSLNSMMMPKELLLRK